MENWNRVCARRDSILAGDLFTACKSNCKSEFPEAHLFALFRHGIVHRMVAPGVAAQDALYSQISPFKNAPFLDGLDGIMRAGGTVTALTRPQQRREGVLVNPDRKNEKLLEQPHV